MVNQQTRSGYGPDPPVVYGNKKSFSLQVSLGHSSLSNGLKYLPGAASYLCASGRKILTTSLQNPCQQVRLNGHDDNVSCLALSPDGTLVASGQHGDNSDVVVWSHSPQRLLHRLSEHDHGVAGLAFSTDGLLIGSIGLAQDNKLFIWDAQTGCIVASSKLSPKSYAVNCIAFGGISRAPDGRTVKSYIFATAGMNSVAIWQLDPYSGQLTFDEIHKQREFTCVAFSEHRPLVFAGTSSGDFFAINVESKAVKCVPACSGGILCLTTQIVASVDDCMVVVGGGDGSVIAFDSEFKATYLQRMQGGVNAIDMSRDGQRMLIGCNTGSVVEIGPATEYKPLLIRHSPVGAITAVDFDQADPSLFATIGDDRCIYVWDMRTFRISSKIANDCSGRPTTLVYSLDIILTGWDDGSIRCHSSREEGLLWTVAEAHSGGVTALKLSSNRRFIISGGVKGEVRLWDLRSRELVIHLKEHNLSVTDLFLLEGDKLALSSSRDRNLLCWDLRAEKRISCHTQRMGAISSIASLDENHILTVGQDRRITCWDLRKPDPVKVVETTHQDDITSIVICLATGNYATGGADCSVKIWDANTGLLIQELEGASGPVTCLKFSPDGSKLVATGADGSLTIWSSLM